MSVQYLKGVGPARAQLLARLGIATVEDLLWTAPRRHEDRGRLTPIGQLRPGESATVRANVLARSLRRMRGGRAIFTAALGDASGIVQCTWFNQPYLAQQINVGDELFLYGQAESGQPSPRARRAGARLQFIHPEIERVEPSNGPESEAGDLALHVGRIVPIYPLTEGVGQRWFRRVVRTAVAEHASRVPDVLPADIRRRYQFKPVGWAMEQLHFPDTWEDLEAARRRLAFEELFLLQVRLAARRARLAQRRKPQRYELEGPLMQAWRSRLPFTLTAGQQAVLQEMLADLSRSTPMLRLLQGDVGCGKTVVAAHLIVVAVQSGHQVALMAPTELLAEQHARVLAGQLDPLGVRVALLSQGVPAPVRRALHQEIADGRVPVVVGTHALIEADIRFKDLALVVIDEQHKFGVVQRSALIQKAQAADVLVMTATPIPRTLALSLYGDLDYSTITELPPGRQPVSTAWLPEAQRGEVYARIRQELSAGRQGYVVYPLVDGGDRQELKAATQMAKRLQADVFPDYPVGLLHGQMRPSDKQAVMQAFAGGAIRLLVSTVIVEVGLDVANATTMLIEHPDRFGLAQLHQLRGRIGRGTEPAACWLITDAVDEVARQRLSAFVETGDGFRLAERDLQLRGPGELLGRHQHGWLRLRIADLIRDRELLELTHRDAVALIAQDPTLAGQGFAALRQRLRRRDPTPTAARRAQRLPSPSAIRASKLGAGGAQSPPRGGRPAFGVTRRRI